MTCNKCCPSLVILRIERPLAKTPNEVVNHLRSAKVHGAVVWSLDPPIVRRKELHQQDVMLADPIVANFVEWHWIKPGLVQAFHVKVLTTKPPIIRPVEVRKFDPHDFAVIVPDQRITIDRPVGELTAF